MRKLKSFLEFLQLLALFGALDLVIQGFTQGEVKLIRSILEFLF